MIRTMAMLAAWASIAPRKRSGLGFRLSRGFANGPPSTRLRPNGTADNEALQRAMIRNAHYLTADFITRHVVNPGTQHNGCSPGLNAKRQNQGSRLETGFPVCLKPEGCRNSSGQ